MREIQHLQIPDQIDEEFKMRTALQEFCEKVILPKLSDSKVKAIYQHMERGISIDGAMALEKIKITVC